MRQNSYHKFIAGLFCFYILILPFLPVLFPETEAYNPVFISTLFFAGLGIALFIGISGIKLRPAPADILVMIYLILGGIHTLFLGNFQPEPLFYVKWAGLVMVYLLMRVLLYGYIHWVYAALALSGTLQSVISLLQYCGVIKLALHPYFGYSAAFSNTGPLAAYVSIGIICYICQLKQQIVLRKTSYIIILIMCLAVMGVAVLLADNRSVFLALLVTGLVYLITVITKKGTKQRMIAGIGLLCITILFTGIFYGRRSSSAQTRILIWKVAGNMFREHPLAGMGPGTFSNQFMYYQAEKFSACPNNPDAIFANNHYQSYNIFIQLATEQGIIGLISFIAILIAILGKSNWTGISFCLINLLIISCFMYTTDVYPLLLLFPLLAGAHEPVRCCTLKITIPPVIKYLFLVLFIFVICWGGTVYKRYQHAGKAIGNTALSSIHYDSLLAQNMLFNFRFSKEIFNNPSISLSKKITILEEMRQHFVTSDMICDLADLYLESKNYKQAEKYYILAHNMVPCRIVPLYKLFQLYCITQNHTQAIITAQRITTLPTSVTSSLTIRIKNEAKLFLQEL